MQPIEGGVFLSCDYFPKHVTDAALMAVLFYGFGKFEAGNVWRVEVSGMVTDLFVCETTCLADLELVHDACQFD